MNDHYPHPDPPREWQMAPHRTPEQIRRARDLGRRVDQLIARPAMIRALVARVTRPPAGGSVEAETPGPA